MRRSSSAAQRSTVANAASSARTAIQLEGASNGEASASRPNNHAWRDQPREPVTVAQPSTAIAQHASANAKLVQAAAIRSGS